MAGNKIAHVNPGSIDVILLCGGLGKRLYPVVSDRPKPMAAINGRPFLDIIMDYTSGFRFRRFILCIGYMGGVLRQHYKGRKEFSEILFSEETKSLGTAGAIKNAENFIKSSPFLVMNGDSFCRVDLGKFLKFHLSKKALCSVVLKNTEETSDYGVAALSKSQRITQFSEKPQNSKTAFTNAGIYLFQKEILSLIPGDGDFSLERNLFPAIVKKEIYGYTTDGFFIDIGTPQKYETAKKAFSGQNAEGTK